MQIGEFTGHKARVLHLAQSPDGSTVCSAAADETLHFWRCFGDAPEKAKVRGVQGLGLRALTTRHIVVGTSESCTPASANDARSCRCSAASPDGWRLN